MWSLGLCRNSCRVLCYVVTLVSTESTETDLGMSRINSLLTVQFNVPQKCYEFKPNTELVHMHCVSNAMNTL